MVVMSGLDGLSLVGGRPALDFINTEGGERNGPPERLGSYGDLVAWSLYAGLVDDEEASALERAAGERPEEAAAVFERAIELREALYRLFVSTAASGAGPSTAGRAVDASDRAVLDRELAEAWSRRRLVPAGGVFEWRFAADGALDLPLWRIVEDAAELLTSARILTRVKECGGPDCTWLFLDESRNRSRRWCEMGECGNRAKARRYRERHG